MVEIETITKDSEYSKLLKMSKGYNWEIKVFLKDGFDQKEADKNHMERLKVIDDNFKENWGGE